VLASAKALKSYYAKNEFDYTFPKGIIPLLLAKNVFALETEERLDRLIITDEETGLAKALASGKWAENKNQFYLSMQADDVLLLLDHASFTQICAWHQGDYRQHRLYDKQWEVGKWREGEYLLQWAQEKAPGKCNVLLILTHQPDLKEKRHNPFTVPMLQPWNT
jgi:hypothetical protein